MEQTKVETAFQWLDKTTELIQQQMNVPYLDSLSITLSYMMGKETLEEQNDLLKQQLEKKAKELNIFQYEKEVLRKTIQLATLKGMKDATQQQHLITPDTVAMFIGYLSEKLIGKNDHVRLFDPACGTGNLLTAVVNRLSGNKQAYGSEVDPTLIQLALMNANVQQLDIEYFHQDSLRPFLLEPVDLVVSDLPVGYYPDDVQASQYELKAEEGHSYSHHLFIEQGIKYAKEGGYLVFVIPNFLFESEQSSQLNRFLHKHAHVIGLLQLPLSMFKLEKNAKSIFILQKKGRATNAPKEALMAQLPSFKNPVAMNKMLDKINQWFQSENGNDE
ncbi:class I SAM-dependent methyltransferase [Aquibacillus sp. 3ASR75-11]|uniref:Class I SAM-dependent methyltransferase n=1 Tax=Terrihalobacillus insolitus TaxID=2950438 RepID=A0A9X3WQM9_9BACI|nr:class I SAM-dependent methyltransferase [Terrihalobacillus insolitus]MDC3412660.1 class I SAM-dependent methyltransferase [Terrihalobacillus insolitus]MDC3424010.1 class I SAM-dependent methyltransferase [Terrihalobacillus insolitus]